MAYSALESILKGLWTSHANRQPSGAAQYFWLACWFDWVSGFRNIQGQFRAERSSTSPSRSFPPEDSPMPTDRAKAPLHTARRSTRSFSVFCIEFWDRRRWLRSRRSFSRSAFSSATFALLPLLASIGGLGLTTGVLAGFACALLPINFWTQTTSTFEAPATAFFLVVLCIFACRIQASARFTLREGLIFGVAAGVGCLVSPALVPLLAGWATSAGRSISFGAAARAAVQRGGRNHDPCDPAALGDPKRPGARRAHLDPV